MYRVNRLPRLTIITTDEVIAMGPVSGNPDVQKLLDSIIIAEERFLKKTMCDSFYYDLREMKNRSITVSNKSDLEAKVNEGNTGEPIVLEIGEVVNAIEFVENEWYKKWWFEFGWKIAAEAVVYTATPINWLRHEAAGEMMNSPKSISMESKASQSGDLKDVQWKMNKMHQDRIDPLIEASHEWLCKNKSHFTLYNCKSCGCDEASGTSVKRKTGFIHGLYDDDKNDCCN